MHLGLFRIYQAACAIVAKQPQSLIVNTVTVVKRDRSTISFYSLYTYTGNNVIIKLSN